MPEFQQLIGFALVRLRTVAEEWVSPEQVRAQAIHPELHLEPPPGSEYDPVLTLVHTRLLGPLVEFGLLEERYLPAQERWQRPWQVRKAPLFDRFLPSPPPLPSMPSGKGQLRLI